MNKEKTNNKKIDNIILMGLKHCGKSTLGKLLALHLNWDFYDIDELTEMEYDRDLSKNIREIYQDEGKTKFQSLEAQSVCNLTNRLKVKGNTVIAFGGGTIENKKAINCINEHAVFIYLKENREILYERIIKGGIPPFLSQNNPYNNFEKIYEKRSNMYEENADLTIALDGRNENDSLDLILSELKQCYILTKPNK